MRMAEYEKIVDLCKIDTLNTLSSEKKYVCLTVLLNQAKAEAIKDYAERLKAELIKRGLYPVIVKNAMEKLAEEMTEKLLNEIGELLREGDSNAKGKENKTSL